MQDLIVSYALLNKGNFRIREGDLSSSGILVNSISGKAIMSGSDNTAGRLYMTGYVEYTEYPDGLHAQLSCIEPEVDIPDCAVPFPSNGNYYRICFRRSNKDWRIRDESGGGIVEYISTYTGVANIDWCDRTSHLYHGGPAFLSEGKAILVPGTYTRPEHVRNRMAKYPDREYLEIAV